MATRPVTSTRSAGCLALFALPFAAVGIGAFIWAVSTLVDWRAASGWIEVPAELVSLELEQHDGDDSTTYETTATYRYDYAGRTYTGDRVAIDTGADNVGDFQHRLYDELRTALERGAPIPAFVDPAEPANAVLNRELRAGLLALKGVFAAVFGIVGFGLLLGVRLGVKKVAAQNALRERYPNEPWRWRTEWANNRIAGSAHGVVYVAIGFGIVWNLLSLPLLFVIPEEISRGNTAAGIGFVFPLIGIGIAAWAIRAWLQLKRFKIPMLTLDRLPVALGGRLKGTIRVEAAVPVTVDFRLALACVESFTSGSGNNRRREERLLWQKEWRVPRHQCQIGAFTTIPVDAPLPADRPATTMDDSAAEIAWRLEVSGVCAGPNFWSRFDLPVFATGTEPRPAEPAPAVADAGERPDASTLTALGIQYESLPQGGEAWTFRRGQHKGVAAAITACAAIWTAIGGALLMSDAPIVLPIVFLFCDALFVWWALSLWLTEYRVTLDRGLLTISRRGLLTSAPIEIPLKWIRGVRAKRGMQTHHKLYYDLQVETAEGSHTAATTLADYEVASWLAQHWMAGGATNQR